MSAKKLFAKEDSSIIPATGSDTAVSEEKTLVLNEEDISSSVPEKLPKEVEKRYQIKRILGKGAFGIVYLAEDRKLGRLVAIKQLLMTHTRNSEIYERFTQEAKISAQLEHPNIINVFGLEEDRNSSCIIMEYLGGGSLASYLQKVKLIDISTAVRIITGILKGLGAAHDVMVIHRDIKPQNILFGPQGEPKISDFGVAHLPEYAGGAHTISNDMTRTIVGTPMYMAPEQIMKQNIDRRADIYSAGAIFYEMLTGSKIFEIDGISDIIKIREIITQGNPMPIPDNLAIPEKIIGIINKMLAKNPDQRYNDAKSVIIDIQEAMENREAVKELSKIPELTIGTTGPLLSSPAAMLEDVIRLFLIDGSLSSAERKELKKRAERLGLSRIQADTIEDKVREELNLPSLNSLRKFSELVESFLIANENCVLSKEQEIILVSNAKGMNIKSKERKAIIQEIRDKLLYQKARENPKLNLIP